MIERLERLWLDVAKLEEHGPERLGLSDPLMNWIYAELRYITAGHSGADIQDGSRSDPVAVVAGHTVTR